MRLNIFLKTLTLLVMLITSNIALALESDAHSEITIESDRAEFDRKAGTAVYIGNVVLVQGTLLIKADRITLYSDENQQLHKAVAIGQPAHFQQQMEENKGLTKAEGQTITYLTQDETVTLLTDAILEQEGNSFNGDQIIYDIVNENIKAKGGTEIQVSPTEKQPKSRIKMIIQPAQPVENTQ